MLMDALMSLVINCSSTRELLHSTNRIIEQLPLPIRRQFRVGVDKYLIQDFDNAYKHVDGKTVADILKETDTTTHARVASGKIDGVKYTLYEAADDDEKVDSGE